MPPNDRRDCAAQILWCGLALGPARLNQRLQAHPCSVRQHRSSSHWEEQNARNHNRFKLEQALGIAKLSPIHRQRWLAEECSILTTANGCSKRECTRPAMTLGVWLTFVAASAALIAIPGPNVALIVANSMAHGRRYGLVTVTGTSAAMVPQLTLTVAGMTGALALASQAVEWGRWLGVAYLVWLGIQAWRAAGQLDGCEP